MKAIIIEDKDAKALVDKLSLAKLNLHANGPTYYRGEKDPKLVDETHGIFLYIVVRWLQDQGASVI